MFLPYSSESGPLNVESPWPQTGWFCWVYPIHPIWVGARPGNLTVFLAVRFVYGLLMNTKPVQLMYVLESVGAAASNRALVVECVLYSIITIALAASCGWVTYFLDWRPGPLALDR